MIWTIYVTADPPAKDGDDEEPENETEAITHYVIDDMKVGEKEHNSTHDSDKLKVIN